MALATDTTPGSIVLAGDLTGTATAPQLRVTGVVPGSYQAANLVIDAKGRVAFAAGTADQVATATTTTPGVVTVGDHFDVAAGEISAGLSNGDMGLVSSGNIFDIDITAGELNIAGNVAVVGDSNTFDAFVTDNGPLVTGLTLTPAIANGESIVCTNTAGCTVSDPTGGDRVFTVTHIGVPIQYTAQTTTHPANGVTGTIYLPVVYGAGRYVTLPNANSNTGYSSTDGLTWTSFTAATTRTWIGLQWNGSVFCAVATDGGVMTSADGTSWSLQTALTSPGTIRGLAVRGSTFLVCATTSFFTSTTGVSWTTQSVPAGIIGNVQAAPAANDNVFIFPDIRVTGGVTYDGRILTSPDGVTWTVRTMPVVNGPYVYVGGKDTTLYAGSNLGGASLAYSTDDGATWTDTGRGGVRGVGHYDGGVLYFTLTQTFVSPDDTTWYEITAQSSDLEDSVSLPQGGPQAAIWYANGSLRYMGLADESTPAPLTFGSNYQFSNTAPTDKNNPWTVECVYVNGDQLCTYL